jgi:hypothetical protein
MNKQVIVSALTLVALSFSAHFVVAVDDVDDPGAEGCFAYRSLTCELPLNEGDNLDANVACLAIEQQIQRKSGSPVGLMNTEKDVDFHQAMLWSLRIDDDLCYAVHNAYHKCWWCARIHHAMDQVQSKDVHEDFCTFKTCEEPDEIDLDLDVTATCEELHVVFGQGLYPATIEFCEAAEQASYQCPVFCDKAYLGADTEPKKKALVWMSRVSAFLSMIGACYILYDVASDKKRRQTVYHQLLFGMAIFDVFTALAWGFATAPIPKEIFWVYGANGSEATCKAQGFFVQLGFTSVFYNVSLAIYYLLVIVYSWKERNLVEIREYLHGIPIMVGVVLAFGGIPVYDWFEYGCHLLPPPDGSMAMVLVLAVGPIGFSIVSIMGCMFTVYWKVRSQARTSRKWSFGASKPNSLEARVFYQSLWYVLSFLISWPILFAMYLASVDVDGPYALTITIAFLAPSQGFNNFLVYIRPKVNHWRTQREKRKNRLNSQSNYNNSLAVPAATSTTENASSYRQNSFTSFRLSVFGRSSAIESEFGNSCSERASVSESVGQSDFRKSESAITTAKTSQNKDSNFRKSDGATRTGLVPSDGGLGRDGTLSRSFSEPMIDPSVLIAMEDRPAEEEDDPEQPSEGHPSDVNRYVKRTIPETIHEEKSAEVPPPENSPSAKQTAQEANQEGDDSRLQL